MKAKRFIIKHDNGKVTSKAHKPNSSSRRSTDTSNPLATRGKLQNEAIYRDHYSGDTETPFRIKKIKKTFPQ